MLCKAELSLQLSALKGWGVHSAASWWHLTPCPVYPGPVCSPGFPLLPPEQVAAQHFLCLPPDQSPPLPLCAPLPPTPEAAQCRGGIGGRSCSAVGIPLPVTALASSPPVPALSRPYPYSSTTSPNDCNKAQMRVRAHTEHLTLGLNLGHRPRRPCSCHCYAASRNSSWVWH